MRNKTLSKIYIISWFGKRDDKNRDIRVKQHSEQLDWCFRNNLDVYVFPQDYDDAEKHSNVTYLKNDHGKLLLPADARNECLKHFYSQSDDFAIIADNDSILHEGDQHCDSKDFVDIFNTIPIKDLKDIDFFFPINPGKVPFSKTFRDLDAAYDRFFIFKRNYDSKGSFAVLKNLKKHYDLEIYYDEVNFVTENNEMISHEDVDFGIQIAKHNLNCLQLTNIVLKEFAGGNSTWTQARGISHNAGKTVLAKKHQLPLRPNGNVEYRSIRIKSQSEFYVDKPGKTPAHINNLFTNL
jgi:hypothetical protein